MARAFCTKVIHCLQDAAIKEVCHGCPFIDHCYFASLMLNWWLFMFHIGTQNLANSNLSMEKNQLGFCDDDNALCLFDHGGQG